MRQTSQPKQIDSSLFKRKWVCDNQHSNQTLYEFSSNQNLLSFIEQLLTIPHQTFITIEAHPVTPTSTEVKIYCSDISKLESIRSAIENLFIVTENGKNNSWLGWF